MIDFTSLRRVRPRTKQKTLGPPHAGHWPVIHKTTPVLRLRAEDSHPFHAVHLLVHQTTPAVLRHPFHASMEHLESGSRRRLRPRSLDSDTSSSPKRPYLVSPPSTPVKSPLAPSEECSAESSATRDPWLPGKVYLLNEKTRSAANRLTQNQVLFMQLFGIVDHHAPQEADLSDWLCPISTDQAELIATAANHFYVADLHERGTTDGYIVCSQSRVSKAIKEARQGQSYMCDCAAHKCLEVTDESTRGCIKQLITAPPELNAAQGNQFTLGLLKLLFSFMKMEQFKAVESGQIDEVNYTLMKHGKKYNFRGIPDVSVYEDLVAADQILVATGEVQSTSLAHVQNLIYGVGKLLQDRPNRPILCITIMKSKHASLAMARYEEPPNPTTEEEGSVGVKFIQSPSQVCLTTPMGVKDFATRLYHCLVRKELQTD